MSSDDSASPDATHYAFKLSPGRCAVGIHARRRRHRMAQRESRRCALPIAMFAQVRLVFRPVTLQNFRFVTEVKSRTGLKLTIASTSWRSMVEHERHDRALQGVHHRTASPHRRVRRAVDLSSRLAGFPLLAWARDFRGPDDCNRDPCIPRGADSVNGRARPSLSSCWAFSCGRPDAFFRRNRPGVYTPDKLPAQVLP